MKNVIETRNGAVATILNKAQVEVLKLQKL